MTTEVIVETMATTRSRPAPTAGTKVVYLIRRRALASRDELIMHWFAHHMPAVVRRQQESAARGAPHAQRYIVTVFEPKDAGTHGWDGMAQLWWEHAPPPSKEPHGTRPTDSFQQKAEPYLPWPTVEHVVVDGGEYLEIEPSTLSPPFPCTRSGFFKVSFLVKAKRGTDYDAFFAHWLDTHVPNVKATLLAAGGFRYVVSQSRDPAREPYAGLAELYFHDETGWVRYRAAIREDGMERWVDRPSTPVLAGRTEMIGIP